MYIYIAYLVSNELARARRAASYSGELPYIYIYVFIYIYIYTYLYVYIYIYIYIYIFIMYSTGFTPADSWLTSTRAHNVGLQVPCAPK